MTKLNNENVYCINCYLKMISMIKRLPRELKNIIFQYICSNVKVLLNRTLYFDNWKYYNIIYNDTYIRKIIRNNKYFLFENYLNREKIYETYTTRRVYTYKNKKFKTYKDYLKNLCDLYEAHKCGVLLQ
jgi:hypothetical protein